MYISQAYNKRFNFLLYLPIPVVFLLIILLNFAVTMVMGDKSTDLIKAAIKEQGEMSILIQSLAPLAFFLVLLLVWVKFVHRQTITSLTTARSRVSWSRIFTSFFLWGGISAATTLLAYYMSPEDFVLNFKAAPFFKMLAIVIVLIPMQTSFEEYLFRGYLMQGLGVATRSTLFALLFTSITFGLMHAANPEVATIGPLAFVYYIGTGLFLGIITLMDDGMELALGFHAANNLVACLLVTSDWTALQSPSILKDISEPAAGIDIIAPVFIFYPLLILLFSKIYRWTDWKQRLSGKIQLPNASSLTH